MKTPSLVALLVLALCSGCATTGPTFQNQKAPNSAILRGKQGMMFLSSNDAWAFFEEIDGVAIAHSYWTGTPNEFFVPPGTHTITLSFDSYGGLLGQDHVTIESEAKHIYHFIPRRVGLELEISLWDETDGVESRKLVRQWRINGTMAPKDTMIPIFIPAK